MAGEAKNDACTRLTYPQDWKPAIQSAAKAQGLSLNEWMRRQILAGLPKSVASKLPEPLQPGKYERSSG